MIERTYDFSTLDNKKIEKTIDDENLVINHITLPMNESLPEHYSNSNIYMIIVRGTMSLKLNDQEPQRYAHGEIINILNNTKMNVVNMDENILEFFVIKTPNPKKYMGEKR